MVSPQPIGSLVNLVPNHEVAEHVEHSIIAEIDESERIPRQFLTTRGYLPTLLPN